jgi:acetyl-CoA C-acetyltransferase
MDFVLERDVHILSAARTPIGRFRGALASLTAVELGGLALRGALERAALDPQEVEAVTMGCVLAAGSGEAPTKQAALLAGLPPTVCSRTVESVCGSAMEAVTSSVDALLAGRFEVVLAGGMESRSRAPYFLEPQYARTGSHFQKGDWLRLKRAGAYRWQFEGFPEEQIRLVSVVDGTAYDGLFWPPERKFMREYALAYAQTHKVPLARVNEEAEQSHRKARQARDGGVFDDEEVPAAGVARDELPDDAELDRMREEARRDLACAFNTSTPADNGAAVLLSTSPPGAGRPAPLGRILGFSRVDGLAGDFIDAPVRAIRNLLVALESRRGIEASRFGILEVNEAFGIQLPLFRDEFPGLLINVNGGAIALGHPLGSAGARLLVTLLYAMRRRRIRFGLVAICFGGGGSYALAVDAGGAYSSDGGGAS